VKKSLPGDAFSFFVALGPGRTQQAVADHFDVSIRTVQRAAKTEDWPGRLVGVEKEARQAADKALAEDLAEMQLRHRKLLRAMAARSAKAMSDFPLTDGMQAIKAAEIVIKLERLLAGEPTERTSLNIEETIKREYWRWLERAGEEAGEGDDDCDAAPATE
jgi:hypothetical protein